MVSIYLNKIMLETLVNEAPFRVEMIRGFAAPVEMPMARGRSRWPRDNFDVRLRQYLHDASRVPISRGLGQRIPRQIHSSRHFGI